MPRLEVVRYERKIMKLFVMFAAAVALFGQEAKVAPVPAGSVPAMVSERTLSQDEVEKLTLVSAQIEVLRARFKIEEIEAKYKDFQEQLGPIAAKQEVIVKAACTSVGVSEEKMKAGGCGISLGVDATGKSVNGQDGKPVLSRVWIIPDQPKAPLKLPADKK